MLPKKYTFILNTTGNKGKSIKFQFYFAGKRFVYGTTQSINPLFWDNTKERPITDKGLIKAICNENKIQENFNVLELKLNNINNRLDNIIDYTIKYFNTKEISDNETIDFEELRTYLDNKFEIIDTKRNKIYSDEQQAAVADPLIKDLIIEFIKDIQSGTKTSKSKKYAEVTINGFRSFLKIWDNFEKDTGKKYSIMEISSKLGDDLNFYFNNMEYSENQKGKMIKNLKTVINRYIKNSITPKATDDTINKIYRIEKTLKNIEKPAFKTKEIALNENELMALYDLDLTNNRRLDTARDIFLIGCYTALRYSDYSRIKPEHIDGDWIKINTQKSKKTVLILIRPELKTILEKYDFKLPTLSSQELGKYIKELGKIAGINRPIEYEYSKGGNIIIEFKYKYELIKTHTARRTGASLMYYSGIPAKDIMSITGHSKLKDFENYIIPDEEGIKKRLMKSSFFKGYKPKLKVI